MITVGDLSKKVESDKDGLMALDGFGPKAFEEVESKLQSARETYFAEAK